MYTAVLIVSTFQKRASDDKLEVNFDPALNEVMSEVRHMRGSPLRLRPPHHLTQLVRELDYSELRHRQTSLQVCTHAWRESHDNNIMLRCTDCAIIVCIRSYVQL